MSFPYDFNTVGNVTSSQGTAKAAFVHVNSPSQKALTQLHITSATHSKYVFSLEKPKVKSQSYFAVLHSDCILLSSHRTNFGSVQRVRVSINPNRKSSGKRFNVPPSAEFVARVSGIPTMAKLPYQETADGLDAAFIGVPIDTGTSNRPGARWCFYSCC